MYVIQSPALNISNTLHVGKSLVDVNECFIIVLSYRPSAPDAHFAQEWLNIFGTRM